MRPFRGFGHSTICAGVAAAVLVAGTPHTQAAAPGDAVPFIDAPGRLVVVNVDVNHGGPYPFLVDTGSSHTSVDAAIAYQLGAPRVAKTLVSTPAGDRWAAVVQLDVVKVGAWTATQLLATEMASDSVALPLRIAGILGRDLLASRPFALDFLNRRIDSPGRRRTRHETSLDLEIRDDAWFIVTRQGEQVLRFVPDSGSDTMVLFDRGQLPAVQYEAGLPEIESVAGRRPARRATLQELVLGTLRLVNVPVLVVDGSDVDARLHGDGLLPLHLFERISFYPDIGRVELWPGASRTHTQALPRFSQDPAQ